MTRYAFHAERFATRVRKWRGCRTQRIAAAELGIRRGALSRVECAITSDLATFMTLCMAMRADPREFWYECEVRS